MDSPTGDYDCRVFIGELDALTDDEFEERFFFINVIEEADQRPAPTEKVVVVIRVDFETRAKQEERKQGRACHC